MALPSVLLTNLRSGTGTRRTVFSMRFNKIKRALRGEVKLTTAAREVLRRIYSAVVTSRERAALGKEPRLSLDTAFSRLSATNLLGHFQNKKPINIFFDLNPF